MPTYNSSRRQHCHNNFNVGCVTSHLHDSCHTTSLAVTLIATSTTNCVRWMILLETSAHTVASQEEIHPGEHRFISRNLRVVTYLRLGFGKSSCKYSDNNLCQVYGAEIRWIVSRPATSLTSMKIQNLSERLPVSFQNSQGVVPTKTDYTRATV